MIDEIRVENLALIAEASLTPAAGLTAITGETGAGKTALLSAFKLLVGERADASMVREGEECLVVEGRVYAGDDDADGRVVRRRVGADGRSRVTIDGSLASVRELGERVGSTIDLCGQHEHQRLLSAAHHVAMIDEWASDTIAPALAAYREKLAAAREAAEELERVREAARMSGARLEEARFTRDRINEVDPQPGELEELEEVLPRAEHAEALVSCAYDAHEALAAEGGALDGVNAAIAELARLKDLDAKLGAFADELAEAAIRMEDAAADLRSYRESIDFDPAELQSMQERLSELRGLTRSFGPRMEDVFAACAAAEELLGMVDDAEEREKRAERELESAEADLASAARDLTRARDAAAPAFCRAVTRQMKRLEMGTAELVWESRQLPRDRWGAQGPCACELLYRSGAGLTPRPMRRIASGGELSRVMLAVKVVLGNSDAVDTLVFDEVDAGVGGATARSLAHVLADLAKTHQVIVVTHLAQVAVLADTQYVVRRTKDERPKTSLVCVEGDERVVEVARMLSGDSSQASLDHAREMLVEARSER